MTEENEIKVKPCKVCESTLPEVHETWCLLCALCETRFQKHFVVKSMLGDYIVCETCNLQELVSHYRTAFEKERDANDRLKTELNLFKVFLLKPETMAAKADDPSSSQPFMYEVRRRWSGIENFSIDQMQWWLECFENGAKFIAETLGKKASREEIKAHLQEKTKKELERVKDAEKASKSVEKKPAVKLTAEDKVIRAYMKLPGVDEKKAREMYQAQLNSMKGKQG